jgi:hypothetical protein
MYVTEARLSPGLLVWVSATLTQTMFKPKSEIRFEEDEFSASVCKKKLHISVTVNIAKHEKPHQVWFKIVARSRKFNK